MTRVEFTNKVKAEIVLRASKPDGIVKCEGCGLVLGKKPYHIDHTLPEGLRLDKSRPLTADDGKLLGWDCCHKPKTAEDVRRIRKADRQRYNHLGIRKRSTWPCGRDSKWKQKVGGKVVLR